jgi:rhamnogalacturonyl hydrolase YesR
MKHIAYGLIILAIATLALGNAPAQNVVQLREFTDWPAGLSPVEVGKKLCTNMLPRWPITQPSVHYAEDSTWMTALKFAALTKDEPLKAALIKRFDPILAPGGQSVISMTRHVDHNIFGIVPLELYLQTKDKKYLDLGKMLADRQWEKPNTNGLTDQTRFWIDDMYMITILQVEAFRATGDKVFLDRAALEMVAYLDKLQQPNGLFFHGPDFHFFWGRGDGWIAAGMPELLSELPADHPRRARIMEGYIKMMAALLKYQDTDGMWRGWLTDPAYAQAARKGWLALQTYIDTDGNVDKVCVGTGQNNSLQYYLTRPTQKGNAHGQAPVLWCAVALLR